MADILSMTGFGSGRAETKDYRVRALLRSVNGRFLDLSLRCSTSLQELEPRLRDRVQSRLSRGKVSGNIEVEETAERSGLPELNTEVAQRYFQELDKLAELRDGGDLSPMSAEALARLPGIFRSETPDPESEHLEPLVLTALDTALDELESMQRQEGATLVVDLRERIGRLRELMDRIDRLASQYRDDIQQRLRDKVEALLRPGGLNEDRLATEIVLIAERSDITEEVVRFRSHTEQFVEALDSGGEIGRRLNFLLQEMHREVNTMSSKSSHQDLIHTAVDAKEEVERLREQIQNLA